MVGLILDFGYIGNHGDAGTLGWRFIDSRLRFGQIVAEVENYWKVKKFDMHDLLAAILEILMKHVDGIMEIEAKWVAEACDNLATSQQLWQFGKIDQIVGGHRMCNSAKCFL